MRLTNREFWNRPLSFLAERLELGPLLASSRQGLRGRGGGDVLDQFGSNLVPTRPQFAKRAVFAGVYYLGAGKVVALPLPIFLPGKMNGTI